MVSSFRNAVSITSKLIIQLWLLGLFLHFFGMPALKRFHEKKVIVVRSVRESDGTPIPAITIAVKGKESGNGWKKTGLHLHITKEHCKNAKSVGDLNKCVEGLTYDLSETSSGVTVGIVKDFDWKIKEPKWTEDYLHNYAGRIYTLEHPLQLNPSILTGAFLRIELKNDHMYDLYIHDPKNFYLTENPEPGFPYVRKEVDPRDLPYYYNLALTEVEELNVPHDPCNEDPNFNYKQCIKEYLSKIVGCRTKWDNNSYPLCQNIGDFR